jgi:hypothetical protein
VVDKAVPPVMTDRTFVMVAIVVAVVCAVVGFWFQVRP